MEKNTFFDTKKKCDCNGCGVCALKCPVNAITMVEDKEGFLYPSVDEEKCIKCNACKKFCGNINEKNTSDEKAYLAINNSKEQLRESSSGGMFQIIAEYVINKGGVVFGVTYDNELTAIHTYAESMDECKAFSGSKYVRSDLNDSYIKVKEFLDLDRYVLFTGTACQISGLKKFLNKEYDKLILCDILCHANPSPKVFKLYIKNIEKKSKKSVKNVLFRSKENGWRNQTPIIQFEDESKEEENSYFNAFVKEMINRPSCYDCKFASKRRITDFTIGDFWGYNNLFTDIDEKNGISLLNVNSRKGQDIFEEIKNKMTIREVDYDIACSYNHYHNVKEHRNRDKFFDGISSGKINDDNIIYYMNKYTKISFIKKCINKMKKIIKSIARK